MKKDAKKTGTRSMKVMAREFITLRKKVNNLPPLSPLEKAVFDSSVDMEHLYYSSKVEGTHLTHKQIRRVTHE